MAKDTWADVWELPDHHSRKVAYMEREIQERKKSLLKRILDWLYDRLDSWLDSWDANGRKM